MKNTMKHGASVAAILAASVASTTASAQDDGFVLEEIIVTAQKRSQSLQDVPISVATLSGDTISLFDAGGEDIRMIAGRVPSVNAESSNGRLAPRFYIRGLGNTDFDLAASQPVSIIMDGVVQENVVLKSFPLFDQERVEVLRGPQGTLFGRNTPAGIIKFDSKKPTREFEGYVNASYGTRGSADLRTGFGGPITETLSYRIAGLYQHRDDWIDNTFTGEDNAIGGFNEYAARFMLMLEPGEDFDALLNFHVRKNRGTAAIFRGNILGFGGLTDNFDRDSVAFNGGDNNPQRADQQGGSLTMNYRLGGATITSITAFETVDNSSRGDIDGLPDMFFDTRDGITDHDQFTQELRVASDDTEGYTWQAGIYYFDSKLDILTEPFFIPGTAVRHNNEAFAVFGQLSFDIFENSSITGGIRYTDDKKDLFGEFGLGGTSTASVEDDRISWDIAVNHNISENSTIYARAAKGFRAPTIQGRDIAFFGGPSIAEAETIFSLEVGIKGLIADERLRYNLAAFRYDMNDQQVSAVGGGGNFITLVNLDETIGWGLEGELEYLASEQFRVSAGFSYNNTQINDEDLLVGTCAICTVTSPTITDSDGNLRAFVDGNPLPSAPRLTFNMLAEFTQPVGDDSEFFITVDWFVQSNVNFLLYESAEFRSGTNNEGGLRTGYRFEDGKYEAALFGRNITDKVNVKGGIDFANNVGYVNEPRIWGVELRANF